MYKRFLLALAVAAVAIAPAAWAQENATLILRSGERVSGQLLDHGGVGFTIKVSGEDRRIPTNQVAVVEFSGGDMTDADWAKVSEGTHVVWLRSGETVSGQFYDIGGTTPLNITFKTASGDRQISSSDIARIVLARPAGSVATSGTQTATTPAASAGGGIVVPAQQAWTSAGIRVRRGEWVTFNTTGEVRLTTNETDKAGAAGTETGRMADKAPLPSAPIGALIGRVGNSQPFLIGNQTRVQMPAGGVLFLGINDDHLADNAGEFRVQVTGGSVR